ncbi:hypothetical protein ACFXG4_43140 [Nocardia sp. NPDC059246]|uniref:hypothetical protein n=1 Tax=unclassified Nocardia TaxID=2637762 RepID=UPI003697CFF6
MVSGAGVRSVRRTLQFAVPFAVFYASWWIVEPDLGVLTVIALPFSILVLLIFPGLSAGVIGAGAVIAEHISSVRGWGAGYAPRVQLAAASLLGGLAGVLVLAGAGEILAVLWHNRDQWWTVISWRVVVYLLCPTATALAVAAIPGRAETIARRQ